MAEAGLELAVLLPWPGQCPFSTQREAPGGRAEGQSTAAQGQLGPRHTLSIPPQSRGRSCRVLEHLSVQRGTWEGTKPEDDSLPRRLVNCTLLCVGCDLHVGQVWHSTRGERPTAGSKFPGHGARYSDRVLHLSYLGNFPQNPELIQNKKVKKQNTKKQPCPRQGARPPRGAAPVATALTLSSPTPSLPRCSPGRPCLRPQGSARSVAFSSPNRGQGTARAQPWRSTQWHIQDLGPVPSTKTRQSGGQTLPPTITSEPRATRSETLPKVQPRPWCGVDSGATQPQRHHLTVEALLPPKAQVDKSNLPCLRPPAPAVPVAEVDSVGGVELDGLPVETHGGLKVLHLHLLVPWRGKGICPACSQQTWERDVAPALPAPITGHSAGTAGSAQGPPGTSCRLCTASSRRPRPVSTATPGVLGGSDLGPPWTPNSTDAQAPCLRWHSSVESTPSPGGHRELSESQLLHCVLGRHLGGHHSDQCDAFPRALLIRGWLNLQMWSPVAEGRLRPRLSQHHSSMAFLRPAPFQCVWGRLPVAPPGVLARGAQPASYSQPVT